MTERAGSREALTKGDLVRRHSLESANRQVDEATEAHVRQYAGQSDAALGRRIDELGREWDTERTLEAIASTLSLAGVVLGATVNKKWLWLPGVVLPFLLQHATQGWCPPLLVIRWLGMRTRGEIDVEKYAIKALRGDFDAIRAAQPSAARQVVEAARI